MHALDLNAKPDELSERYYFSKIWVFLYVQGVVVPSTTKGSEGDRIYDREHACYFCGKLDKKVSRHLMEKHKEEKEVSKVLLLDKVKNRGERKLLLDALRYKGDFFHNAKVLKTSGSLIVGRRPPNGVTVSFKDYVPCKYCLMYVIRHEIARHCSRCRFKGKDQSDQSLAVQKQCEMLLYPNTDCPGASLELEEWILRNMNKDAITDIVKKDYLILTYGSFLMSGRGNKKSNHISQNMRVLGRLLLELRKKKEEMTDRSLSEFLKPEFFDDIVDATKSLAGYSATNKDGEMLPSFEIPSLPLKVGYALDSAAMLLQGIGLRRKQQNLVTDASNFQIIYNQEWSVKISSASLRTLADNKFNKNEVMPLTDDLLRLRNFCLEKIQALTLVLKKSPSLDKWRELAELVITRITIFNKRRGNEVSSLLVKRFQERKERHHAHNDILQSLTPLEQQLMQRYVRTIRER